MHSGHARTSIAKTFRSRFGPDRDFKTYVPPDHRLRRDADFDDDDLNREIEFAVEEPLRDEDDNSGIDPGWIDFLTRDQLLDAVLSQATEEALALKKRRQRAAKKRQRLVRRRA